MIAYRAPAPAPWKPARQALAQITEKRILDLGSDDVQNHLAAQGIAVGYGILASVVYGKHPILDRILLGLGAIAFGAATYTGFKLGLDHKPSKHPVDYVVGTISGALNGLISIGAIAATVNPKLMKGSAADAVKAAIPI